MLWVNPTSRQVILQVRGHTESVHLTWCFSDDILLSCWLHVGRLSKLIVKYGGWQRDVQPWLCAAWWQMNLWHWAPGGGVLKIKSQVISAMCPHEWTGCLQAFSSLKTRRKKLWNPIYLSACIHEQIAVRLVFIRNYNFKYYLLSSLNPDPFNHTMCK